jgi:hypothetical protein
MRPSSALRVGTLVLLLVGVAHAEAPDSSQRFVRTSLDAAPVLELRSPPRVITSSLDQRETEVLGALEPRQLRRSLDEVASPPSGPASPDAVSTSTALPGTTQSGTGVANAAPTSGEPRTVALPGDGTADEAPSWQVSASEAVPEPEVEGARAGYGALDCDCARTRRQIRLTLDGTPAAPAPESTRIIRVQL